MDGFVFTGFSDASGPDASTVGDPDGSVVGFSDASVEEENGDERLNPSLFVENNALIGAAPFKIYVIILFI